MHHVPATRLEARQLQLGKQLCRCKVEREAKIGEPWRNDLPMGSRSVDPMTTRCPSTMCSCRCWEYQGYLF
ncbi:unnamed protein product [Urochloa humidicola]